MLQDFIKNMDDLEIDGDAEVGLRRPAPVDRFRKLNKLHEKGLENTDSIESGYSSCNSDLLSAADSFLSGEGKKLRDEICPMESVSEQCENGTAAHTDNSDLEELSNKTKSISIVDEGFQSGECDHLIDRITPEALALYGQDSDGDTVLFLSIINGQVNVASVIIDMAPQADWLDIYNELRQTALHLAVLMKQPTIVRRLVVGGASVEMCDHNGDTPLHIACRLGDMDTTMALLEPVKYNEIQKNEYKIRYPRIPQNLEIRNSAGCTCMHVAAENGHLNIMKVLLFKGAQINNGDGKRGATVLHYAAEKGDMSLTLFLLGMTGINVDSKMYNGSTPAAIAYCRGYSWIVDILSKFGAKTGHLSEIFDSENDDSDSE